MIAEKKNLISHALGSTIPLSSLVNETTETMLRRQRSITSRAKMNDDVPADHMRQTHASALKKKELSKAALVASIKTYNGWKVK